MTFEQKSHLATYGYAPIRRLLLLFIALWLSAFCLLAIEQQPGIALSGTVVDTNGEPIIGANIIEQGTSNGTVSDVDGRFSLTVAGSGSVLEISYIGYISQTVAVGSRTSIAITLHEDAQRIDELVVVGYNVQRKKDLSGAVAVLSMKDVATVPVSSPDLMMQGRLAGINVMADNSPGGGVAVRVRGFSTLRNNDPLYIIDGVPVEGGINFLNSNDIESIQVLKDASSASIYGSRAANGVVIISTKRGREGRTTLQFDGYAGIQMPTEQLQMLNAQEFGDMLWQAQLNDGKQPSSTVYGKGPKAVVPQFLDAANRIPAGDVDWVDEITRPAAVQSYNLSLSKGDRTGDQLFSLSYFDQEGLFQHTGFRKLTGRFNAEYRLLNDRLTVGENLTAVHGWGTSVTNNSALGGMLYNAYKTVSITPVRDLDGRFGSNPLADIQNPLGELYRNKDNRSHETRLFGNIYAQLKLTEQLAFRTSFGGDYKNLYRRFYNPRYIETNTQRPLSNLTTSNGHNFNYVFTNTLNYQLTTPKHTVNALLGIENIGTHYETFSATRDGFATDDENFRYLDAGNGSNQKNSGTAYRSAMLSFFGKVDYAYDNRYLLGLTLRRDGSSKLGDHKWGNFPAVSAGWRISSEPFFAIPVISNAKLRAGWGQNGNSDIPAYSSVNSYRSNPNHSNYPMNGQQHEVQTGYTQTRHGNRQLRWETTTQTNIGLDLGLFDNDLTFTLDWFYKTTKDILWNRTLIGTAGGTNQTVWDNVGRMLNTGFEAEVFYRKQVGKSTTLSASLNFSTIHNRLTALENGVAYIGLPSGGLHSVNFGQEVSRSAVGQPVGAFYAYRADGLFRSQAEVDAYVNGQGEKLQPNARPGDIRFADVDANGVINSNDRTFIGSPQPDFTMGLTLAANVGNFDVSLFFQGMFGNDVYDLTRYIGDFYNQSQYNKHRYVLDAWSPTNPNATVPRLTQDDPNNNIRPSSYYVSDASFVRFKNVKIGYSLPAQLLKPIKLERLYLYLQANNLFTLTGYKGSDPEVGLQNYSGDYRNIDIGVDRGIYPLARTFTVGFNVTL